MAMLVKEPVGEFLRVYDKQTGGVIICTNSKHAQSETWRKQTFGDFFVPVINCQEEMAFERDDGIVFDIAPTQNVDKQHPSHLKMLVDYACLMHIHLREHKAVLVYCKTGRSRSPNVILSYLLLHGVPKGHACRWLSLAFQNQRPTVAQSTSGEFPNWGNFANLTTKLESEVRNGAAWIQTRMSENIGGAKQTIGDNSSSTTTGSLASSLQINLPSNMCFMCPEHIEPTNPATRKGSRARKRPADVLNPQVDGPSDLSPSVLGRRIKIFNVKKNRYRLGIVTNMVDNKGTRFGVAFDDGSTSKQKKNDIEAAFPVGTRVKVDWEKAGRIYDGVVIEWGGANVWTIRYDQSIETQKIWPTPYASHHITLSTKPLPYHIPATIRQMYNRNEQKNKRQKVGNKKSSSSSSSSSSSARRKKSTKDDTVIDWTYECPSHVKGNDRSVWKKYQCKYSSTTHTFDKKRNRKYYTFQSDLFVGQWPSTVKLFAALRQSGSSSSSLQRLDGSRPSRKKKSRASPGTGFMDEVDKEDEDDGAFPLAKTAFPQAPVSSPMSSPMSSPTDPDPRSNSRPRHRKKSKKYWTSQALTKKLLEAPLTSDFIKKCCSRDHWKKIVRCASEQSNNFTKNITSWGSIWNRVDPKQHLFLTSYKKTSIKNKLNDHRRKYQRNIDSNRDSESDQYFDRDSDSEDLDSYDDSSDDSETHYRDREDSITTNRVVPLRNVRRGNYPPVTKGGLEEFLASGPTIDEAIAAGLMEPLPVGDSKEVCIERRQIRNRLSAQLHRERKKLYIENLEHRVQEQADDVERLERVVQRLAKENLQLREQVGSRNGNRNGPPEIRTNSSITLASVLSSASPMTTKTTLALSALSSSVLFSSLSKNNPSSPPKLVGSSSSSSSSSGSPPRIGQQPGQLDKLARVITQHLSSNE